MKPILGKTEAGEDLAINVDTLLRTRMLLDAESGGGKTVALKRLLEQTHGHVQQIVIDPEGEFSTLREKFDYLLCAPEGADAIANPKTAVILARKLRETRVSTVIDIYDLRPAEQRLFVRLFIEELLAAPKNLWNPCLVVIDEAQIFAPEQGEAESLGAIMDLRGRGRKRGLCLILATPRLAQLSKDACAGLQNKLIGVTTLDLDVKRAARDLSMQPNEATTLLRNLEPGEFYCFGPALTRTITKIKVGTIQTAHGQHVVGKGTRPPAPSEKIKDVIAKLTDLPKEAEQEARSLADLKRENTNLKRELTLAKKEQPKQPATEIKTIEKPVVGMKAIKGILQADVNMRKNLKKMHELKHEINDSLFGYQQSLDKLLVETKKIQNVQTPQKSIPAPIKTVPIQRPVNPVSTSGNGADNGLSRPQQSILNALAAFRGMGVDRVRKNMLAAFSGASPRSSAYMNNLGKLRTSGLIAYPSAGDVGLTAAGAELATEPTALTSNGDLHAAWMHILPRPQWSILASLIAIYPGDLDKDGLAKEAGASPTSSAYMNNLGALRSLGAVDYPERGRVRATDMLFPFGN